jgi:hypothetical protein
MAFESTVYHPMPHIEVVTNDTDESIGVCSLMTITYLFATGHDISLYGYISNPVAKVETIFDGPITLREWIIALNNFDTPCAEELLDYLEAHNISTNVITPNTVFVDTETTGIDYAGSSPSYTITYGKPGLGKTPPFSTN